MGQEQCHPNAVDDYRLLIPERPELESADLKILLNNKSYEDVTVRVSARPLFKLLDGNVVFFWFKWLCSFIQTDVRPGQIKVVNNVTKCNAISYKLGSNGWRLYNIRVQRTSDGCIATCSTPLHCIWIAEENGIYQEDYPQNRCRFKPSASN